MERNLLWGKVLIYVMLTSGCLSSTENLRLSDSDNSNPIDGNLSYFDIEEIEKIEKIELSLDSFEIADNEAVFDSDNPNSSDVPSAAIVENTENLKAEVMSLISFCRKSSVKPLEKSKPFVIVSNYHVDKQIEHFASKRTHFIQTSLKRAEPYIDEIKKIFSDLNLPEELAYLPLIESGFNNIAVSNKGATGMWQFMPGTAKWMGMKLDTWVDERKDPIIAAKKAAKYLKFLYEKFDCWYLSLAAYNYGGFNLRKAMKRGGTTDYFELIEKSVMPKETSDYVPKFIASIIMIKNAEKFNIDYKEEQADYRYVHIPFMASVHHVSKTANIDINTFSKLNPALRTRFVPASNYNYEVRLPIENAEILAMNMETLKQQSKTNYVIYYIKAGDSLSLIADRYGVTMPMIMSINGINNPNRIWQGQRIYIPSTGYYANQVVAKQVNKQPVNNIGFYRVRKGETLSHIAIKFGVSQVHLTKLNNIKDPSFIKEGDLLRIK